MDFALWDLSLKVEGSGWVEGPFCDFVKCMTEAQRLESAMEFLRMALDMNESAQDVVTDLWGLILKEKWWKVRFECVEDFTAGSGIAESVARVAEEREVTRKAKRRYGELASERWDCADLRTLLGPELMPSRASKTFLEMMKTLAGRMPDAEEAVELLRAARDERLKMPRAIKDLALQPRDVNAVLQGLNGGKRVLAIAKSRLESTVESTVESMPESTVESMLESRPESTVETEEAAMTEAMVGSTVKSRATDNVEEEQESAMEEDVGRVCGCNDVEIAERILEDMEMLPKKDVKGRVEVVSSFGVEEWKGICHQHVRAIASCWELKTSEVKRGQLIERVLEVQRKAERLDELARDEQTYQWFRMEGRPGREDDGLGPFKYAGIRSSEFTCDRAEVWERYGGVGMMDKFLEDGNVVVSGVFDWIVKDCELMDMVDAEFEMYRHHLREQNGKPNYGWCRNMWHSLVQQVMRQDPVFYALNVAARPDGNWRLVSFPSYTKYAMPRDSTGFKHIDLNIAELVKLMRGWSVVQTAISMDDEFEDGCTIMVPGFHNKIGEWWSKVEGRGETRNALVQSVKDWYSKEDEKTYGSWMPVWCKRGDVRITLGSIIHGSTPDCPRRRRVVHPWLVGVDSNHQGLELKESGPWEEVSKAHRDMSAMNIGPTGESHRFGLGSGQFAASVEIRGVSAIGDALVGARRWDSGAVLKERDAVLGGSALKAWTLVERHRSRMSEAWKEAFTEMVELEKAAFEEKSYFHRAEHHKDMDIVAQAASYTKRD